MWRTLPHFLASDISGDLTLLWEQIYIRVCIIASILKFLVWVSFTKLRSAPLMHTFHTHLIQALSFSHTSQESKSKERALHRECTKQLVVMGCKEAEGGGAIKSAISRCNINNNVFIYFLPHSVGPCLQRPLILPCCVMCIHHLRYTCISRRNSSEIKKKKKKRKEVSVWAGKKSECKKRRGAGCALFPSPLLPRGPPMCVGISRIDWEGSCSVNYGASHVGGRPCMGMEVGVANELVVAVEEGGGRHKTSRDTERVDAQRKGRIASSECFFLCVCVCLRAIQVQ